MKLGLSLSLASTAIGTPAAQAPTNSAPPEILGTPVEGATRDIFAGTWTDYDTLEIRVITQDDGATVLDWTVVDGDDNLNLTGTLGETLIPQARATKNGATSAAVSGDPFGPIVASETLIAALCWTFSGTPPAGYTNLTPTSSGTVTDTAHTYVDGTKFENPNFPPLPSGSALQLGFSANSLTVQQHAAKAEARCRGAFVGSGSSPTFIVELPSAGTYRVYTSHGTSVTVNCGLEIWEGAKTSGTLKHSVEQTSIANTQVMDATGVARTVAAWAALSTYGGAYVEITVSTPKLVICGRSNNAVYLSSLSVLKVN